MTETVLRVLADDGETTAAEVIRQEGGNAALLRCSESFHTPAILEQIGQACLKMAANIKMDTV